jgi:squalene synthase HpnC
MLSGPDPRLVLDQARSENFPVASRLFPKALRPHLMNIYGFARMADDLGDEAGGDRLAQLQWLSDELTAIFAGAGGTHPLMRRLAITVRRFGLPREPFDRLVAANRQDQAVHRYATYDDLRGYCHLSADPVGELVLRLTGRCSDHLLDLSDATCTGLQLIEFLQDLGEDAAMGRIYVPLEDLVRFEYGEHELLTGVTNDRFRRLMAFEAGRARSLLERGRPLSHALGGRAGMAVRLFTAGGLAALADLRQRGFDTVSLSAHVSRPRLWWFGLRELSGVAGRTPRARERAS